MVLSDIYDHLPSLSLNKVGPFPCSLIPREAVLTILKVVGSSLRYPVRLTHLSSANNLMGFSTIRLRLTCILQSFSRFTTTALIGLHKTKQDKYENTQLTINKYSSTPIYKQDNTTKLVIFFHYCRVPALRIGCIRLTIAARRHIDLFFRHTNYKMKNI